MRLILFLLLLPILSNAQRGIKDFQIQSDSTNGTLLLLGTDTTTGSLTKDLGQWYRADSLLSALGGDTDWYKLGTTLIPFNADSAFRTGYTAWHGTEQSEDVQVKVLKEGILEFDGGIGLSGRIFSRVKPLEQSNGEPTWNFSVESSPGEDSRYNAIFHQGWNLSPGGVRTSGTGTAFGQSYEDHYSQTTTQHFHEWHLVFVDSTGSNKRIQSYVIDKGSPTDWYGYHTVGSMYLVDPTNNGIFTRFQRSTDEGAAMQLLSSDSGFGAEISVNADANTMSIGNYFMTNPDLYTTSFNYLYINKAIIQNSGPNPVTSITGRDGSGTVGSATLGYGIDLTSGTLLVDTSQIATQFDLDHGNLDGLSDDDHTQYALLAGRAGGQILYGGNAANDDLTLQGTSHGTDASSYVLLQPSGNGKVGIGTSAPATKLEIVSGSPFRFRNAATDGFSVSQLNTKSWGWSGLDGGMFFNLQNSDFIVTEGSIGIGTSAGVSPSQKLHVVGQARITASGGTATTITGRDADEDITDVSVGYGIDFTSGTILADTSELATQYDLTLISAGMDTYATIKVDDAAVSDDAPTLDFSSTDFGVAESPADEFQITIQAERIQDIAGAMVTGNTETGITVTYEDSDGTFDFVATDASATNEAWTIDGDAGDTELISNQTVLFAGAGIAATSYNAAANTLTITATEVDGSTTNELNTIEEGNSSVQTGNLTLDFQTLFDVATDGGTEVNISLDLSEATTITTPESDDWIILHDAGLGQHQKIVYPDFLDIISEGITPDGNGIYDGSGTVPTGTTATLADGTFKFTGGSAVIKLEDTGTQPTFALEGNIGDADANFGTVTFNYTDSDYAAGSEQTAWSIHAQRETDDLIHTTLIFNATQSSTSDMFIMEQFESLSNNTHETYTQINSGVAYSQYWESSGSNAITLDRGYYNVVLLSGHSGTITLPQIQYNNENYTEMVAASVSVGQEYVISNFSGSAVTIACFGDAGSLNDDYLNGVENGTFSLANNESVIVKAVTIISNEGRWFTYD